LFEVTLEHATGAFESAEPEIQSSSSKTAGQVKFSTTFFMHHADH